MMAELPRDWDILDDWRDCYAMLKEFGAKKALEAQAAWLLRHHCTNKEAAKGLSIILEKRVTEQTVKRELDRLSARLRLRGRSTIARRVERLTDEYRAAREGRSTETKPPDTGPRPADGKADLRPERRRRGAPRPPADGEPDGRYPSPP